MGTTNNLQFETNISEFCYFQLGLTDVFTINSNLGGITTQEGTLTVSDIVHKAELEVNEKGGTASAATGMQYLG
jgi:serine protease inhibitor